MQEKKQNAKVRNRRKLIQKNTDANKLMEEHNARAVFAVYNCKMGENKIIKKFNNHQSAENYAIRNCDQYQTGLQIRKVYTKK